MNTPSGSINMAYELFILGELMDHPQHGYVLHQIISMAIGPFRRMSWGALYPLMHRLEQDGLIAPHEDDAGTRQRKLYRITDDGRARFRDLMLHPNVPRDADFPHFFDMQVLNFDRVSADERHAILNAYLAHLRLLRDHLERGHALTSDNTHIPDSKRACILDVIARRLLLARTEDDWVKAYRKDEDAP